LMRTIVIPISNKAAFKSISSPPPTKSRTWSTSLVARVMMLEPDLSDPDSPAAKMAQKYLDRYESVGTILNLFTEARKRLEKKGLVTVKKVGRSWVAKTLK